MDSIVVVSSDICAVKQIINVVNTMNHLFSPSIFVFDIIEFKKYISLNTTKNTTYFIDIYDIENEFLDIVSNIRKKDITANIIILSINNNLKSLLNSQSSIYSYINKKTDFSDKIFEILLNIISNDNNKIDVSDSKIPVTFSKNNIDGIYKWPDKNFSINYKNGNDSFLLSLKTSSKELNQITNGSFYTDSSDLKCSKRKFYSESFKQLLVDLYLIYNIDYKTLSRFFHIDARYIKSWSNLAKYNRKLNIFKFWMGKLIIKTYLKK